MFSTRFSGTSSFDSFAEDFFATRAASLASFSSSVFGVFTFGDFEPVLPSVLRGELGGVVEVEMVSLSFCNGVFCGGADADVDGVAGDSGLINVVEGCGAGVGGIGMMSDVEKSVVVENEDKGAESSEFVVSQSLGGALGESIDFRSEMLGERRNGTSGNSSSTDGSFVRTRKKNRIGASLFHV